MVIENPVPHYPALSRRTALLAAVLFLGTVGIYFPTIRFGFVNFDDPGYVYNNVQVRAGLTAETIVWAFTTGAQGNWHPLTWLSHALDWSLYGEWAGGHHLTSAALHAVTVGLLFLWLFQCTGAAWASAFAAAMFGWHPLHVESVAWVSERKDVLCGLFFVLGLMAYTRYARAPSAGRYVIVLLVFTLALLSKPMAVTFPLVLLLVDVWPLGRGVRWVQIREKAPLLVLAGAHAAVTLAVQQAADYVRTLEAVPFPMRLENAAVAYGMYALKTVAPRHLAVFYPYPPGGPAAWQWIAGALFLMCGSALAVVYRRRFPYLFVGWFWFVVMLVPVIGIVQVGAQAMADRYMYLPQIGLVIGIGWTVRAWAAGSAVRKRAVLSAAIAVLTAYCGITCSLLPVWRDSFALFGHALAVTRDNATAHVNLGDAYFNAKDFERAARHSEEAIRIDPRQANAFINLGLARAEQKRWEEAAQAFQEAIRLKPGHPAAHCYLGQTLESRGKIAEAAQEYAISAQLDPNFARAHEKLGGALLLLGRGEEAERAYRRAVELDPSRAGAWASLGVSLCSLGQFTESLPNFRRALELDPSNADARFYYARALSAAGERNAALEQLGILLANAPGHPDGLTLRQELEFGAGE